MDTVESIDVRAGEVIAGKYEVEGVLGVGGMGYVVAARHVHLDEYVALKFLHKQFLTRPGVAERFTREARAACKIKSAYVARVYDVGAHFGAPFLVMEHLVGRDLATAVAQEGPLSIDAAVECTMQTCAALAAAHALGIVHRDVKPENLFLVEQQGLPTIKLLDFGVSRIALTGLAAGEVSRMTGTTTLGTPLYMSPEQIRSSASADARSDLWSLGVVLYELLAATPAFQAEGVSEVFAAVLEQEPRPLQEVRPDVPTGLAEVVERCMRKDPAARFQDAAELAAALLPYAPARAIAVAEQSSSTLRSSSPQSLGRIAAATASDPSLRAAATVRAPSPVSMRAPSLVPASSAGVVLSMPPRLPLGPWPAPAATGPASSRRTGRAGRSGAWAVVTTLFLAGALAAGGITYRVRDKAAPGRTAAVAATVPATAAATTATVVPQPAAADEPPQAVDVDAEPLVGSDDARPLAAGGAPARLERKMHRPRAAAAAAHAPASSAAPPPTSPPTASTNAAPSTQPGIDLGY